ncbi:MAG: type II toxin-antitoxin system VapC family toxin [Patescibacteria group bacterium]
MNLVIDANIALKWYYQEADSPEALKLREQIINGQIIAIVPFLLFVEVANVLVARRKVPGRVVAQVLDDLAALPMEVVPYHHVMAKAAVALADQHRISVYDGLYVALAEQSAIKLLTEDTALLSALPNHCRRLEQL